MKEEIQANMWDLCPCISGGQGGGMVNVFNFNNSPNLIVSYKYVEHSGYVSIQIGMDFYYAIGRQ